MIWGDEMFQGMEYVYTVYKEKSFSKAAKVLFISQPSLSATIKRIENRVGFPIFDRSTKPLSLTECGERYIHSVEQIMTVENDFSNYMNDWGELKNGSLVIGGSSLYSSLVLPEMMARFTRKYPGVELILVEESTAKLALMLQKGEIDLIFDNCSLDSMMYDREIYARERLLLAVPKNLAVNQLAEDYQIPAECIVDGTFADEKWKSVPLKIFENEPFIMLKVENDTRKRAMDLCHGYGFEPKILFELDQQMTSYHIACSGMGISFVSDTLVSGVPINPNIVYYKIEEKRSVRKLYFYWKRGRYFSRAMEEFLRIAKEKAQ